MKIFSAAWVLPMDGPPLRNAEVVVEDGLIVSVRKCITPSNERRDFGNAILMPGLVNAHTHLEYTVLRGFLEDVPFFPWIRALTMSKAHLNADDWLMSARLGALECLASGTTTIGDNTDAGVTVDAARELGLRGTIYQEFFCIDHRTSAVDVLDELAGKLVSLDSRSGTKLKVGISPHATYTVNPAAFSALKADLRIRDRPISIHVSESAAEVSLIESGTGPFAEMFDRRGIVWNSPRTTPTRYVADQGVLGRSTLAIHCTHQLGSDIDLIADSGSAIIHCPKSNAKLGAGIAPLTEWLRRADLKLGMGTDSAVSNNSLDLFEEMRFALLLQRGRHERVEAVTAKAVLELATIRGANSMGLGDEIGSLTPGKKADMIAVNLEDLHQTPATDPMSAIVYSTRGSDVRMTMIDGEALYDDGKFAHVDISTILEENNRIRTRLPQVEI